MDTETIGIIAAIVGSIAAVVGILTAILVWMMSKLDTDIRSISASLKEDRISLNARIDTTQSIIMRMLEKQGK